jgi:acetyltransferase
LKLWGIPVVQEQVVKGLGEATEVSTGIGFPLVMKGLIPGRVHKSESGLVYLGIQSPKAVADSFQRLKKDMGGRGRVLVQQQADKDFELMAGFIRDDQFGPCVLFGLGGTLAELDPDVAFALAPVDLSEALNLMGRIRGKALLEGYRGMPPLNKDLMADLLVRVSEMGIRYPRIEQVDINPVVVKEGVPIAVDATIVMKGDR